MSTIFINVPGLFQFRKSTCCLACGLKDFGLDDGIIRKMLVKEWNVEQIFGQEMQLLMESFPSNRKKAIEAIAHSVIDLSLNQKALLVHHNYYRVEEVKIAYESVFGKLQRGEVLEIFQSGTESIVTEDIIYFMRRDFLDFDQRRDLYTQLPGIKHESCVTISINDELSSISSRSPVQERMMFMIPAIPRVTQLKRCEAFLTGCESVSMIVVRDLVADTGNVPTVTNWIKMFGRVFGSLDDMMLVFIVKYETFRRFRIIKKSKVQEIVNRKVSPKMFKKLKILDVTCANDMIMARGPMRKLKVVNAYKK